MDAQPGNFFAFSLTADPAMFYGVFVKRYWQDDEHFIICDYLDEIFYVCNFNQDDYAMRYEPVNNTWES
jgi:hypothetical protein